MNVLWLEKYLFTVVPKHGVVPVEPGLYILSARALKNQRWLPLYVGKTEYLDRRSSNHQNSSDDTRSQYSHFQYMVENDPNKRDLIEAELIQALQPPWNVQLK